VSEIKRVNKTIVKMEKKSLTQRIWMQRNIAEIESSLKNVVKEGQGQNSTQGLLDGR
jgi:hypothetical protein